MRKRINNNSYYGHYESVVVAMFYDEDDKVRKKGLDEVLGILDRQEEKKHQEAEQERQEAEKKQQETEQEQQEVEEETQPKKKRRRTTKKMAIELKKSTVKPQKKVRHFLKPKLDWNVAHYYDWIKKTKKGQKTMPPVFVGLTREQLQEAARLGQASDLRLHKFMGNTQCVEREIKIQTELSQQVKSLERREQESAR